MEQRSCFLCKADTVMKENVSLQDNVKVIFLVHKLLQIPLEKCGSFLSKYGNPVDWIQLCSPCSSLVHDGQQLFLEITSLKIQFEGLRSQVRCQVVVKAEPEPQDDYWEGTLGEDSNVFHTDTFAEEEIRRNINFELNTLHGQANNKEAEDCLDFEITPDIIMQSSATGTSEIQRIEETDDYHMKIEVNSPGLFIPSASDVSESDVNIRSSRKTINGKKVRRKRVGSTKRLTAMQHRGQSNDKCKRKEAKNRTAAARLKIKGATNRKTRTTPKLPVKKKGRPRKVPDAAHNSAIDNSDQSLPGDMEHVNLDIWNNLAAKVGYDYMGFSHGPLYVESSTGDRERTTVTRSRRCTMSKIIQPRANETHSSESEESESESTGDSDYTFGKKKIKIKKTVTNEVPESKSEPSEDNSEESDLDVPSKSWNELVEAESRKNELIEIVKRLYSKNVPEVEKIDLQERRRELLASLSKLAKRHKIIEFPCSNCSEVLKNAHNWSLHQLKHSSIKIKLDDSTKFSTKPYSCELCGKESGTRTSLEHHHRVRHLPEDALICRGCNVSFKRQAEFNRHIKDADNQDNQVNEHDNESNKLNSNLSECRSKSFLCPKCPELGFEKFFSSQKVLDLHIKFKHIDFLPKPYKCLVPDCGKSFGLRGSLERHAITHRAERPFICEKCGSSFRMRKELLVHEKIVHLCREPGAKNFPCKVCGKEFFTPSKRKRHEVIHFDDAPHLCTICGKRFKLTNYLTIHMWTHDPDKREKYSMYKPKDRNRLKKPSKKRGESQLVFNDNWRTSTVFCSSRGSSIVGE